MKLVKFAVVAVLGVCAIALLASPAFSEAKIGLTGVGGKVGFVVPEDPIESTFGLGVLVGLGTITPALELEGFVDFWKKSYDTTVWGGTWEYSYTEIAVGALVKYPISMSGQLKPYVGGGLALNRLSFSSEGAGILGTSTSSSDIDIAIHLVGGAEMPISPTMTGVAEAKYAVGGADYLGIFAGVMYQLAK